MNTENLKTLYQKIVLEHSKHPRHFGELQDSTHIADRDNPLCGDHITVYAQVVEETIQQLQFAGVGCAICLASASMMTEELHGKSCQEAETLSRTFFSMLSLPVDPDSSEMIESLGTLNALGGVRRFPSRIQCARLAWETLGHALGWKE